MLVIAESSSVTAASSSAAGAWLTWVTATSRVASGLAWLTGPSSSTWNVIVRPPAAAPASAENATDRSAASYSATDALPVSVSAPLAAS